MADHYQQQSNIDEIKRFTVGIMRSADSDSALGTGVIVTDDGLIVTCYHVISDLYKKIISNTLYVSFPAVPGIRIQAQVVDKHHNSSLDIAFLQLQDKLPKEATFANLSESIEIEGHKFKSYGYRRQTIFKNGVYSPEGRIEGKVQKNFAENKDIALSQVIQLTSDGIDHGMSGAAVLDKDINRVVGIVSEHLATLGNIDKNLALAIPIESTVKVCPELEEKNPGLKIFEFLRKIRTEDMWYQKIDELYVPPLEYDEIIKTLNEYRIVFITGTKQYGKTYTAVKLLWEFDKKGYEPNYIVESDKEGTSQIQDRLLGLDEKLRHHIIYFEDPVGKIQYTRNEKFESQITDIKDVLSHLDVYIIISMREEIYQKFNPIGKKELKKFVKEMNIGNHSYDEEKRKEMLLRWAKVVNCGWLGNEKLKNAVLNAIENESKLVTPLNIKAFVMATDEKHEIKDESKLLEILNAKSKAIAEDFAIEIKGMTKDKILFLSFLFISDEFSVDFIKTNYQESLTELDIKKDDWTFQRALRDFKNDKVSIIGERVTFSHPSYSEALSYILLEDEEEKIPSVIYIDIFSNVLYKLARHNRAAEALAKVITINFDNMPEDAKRILLTLAGTNATASTVAEVIQNNFDKLPGDVLYELFKTLTNIDYKFWDTVEAVSSAIISNSDNMQEKARVLLSNLADNGSAALIVSRILTDNFDKLTNNLRSDLLLKLIERNGTDWTNGRNVSAAEAVVECLLSNFDKFAEDMTNQLISLAGKSATAKPLAKWIRYNLDKLPEKIVILLLDKLQANKDAVEYVAKTITNYYDKLPEDVKRILFRLADDKYAAEYVANGITDYYDKLPEDVRDLLFTIADKYQKEVAVGIYDNFLMISENTRNKLLVKLANSEEAARDVARIVCENFDKLPEDVRDKLLLKLADSKEAAWDIARAVTNNFDRLPEDVRDKLLLKLADSKEAAWDIFLFSNSHKLSQDIINKSLLKLADNKETARYVSDIVDRDFDRLPEYMRNELLVKLADNENEARYVAYAVDKNFDKLPEDVRDKLLLKLADSKEAAWYIARAVTNNFDKLPEDVQNLLFKLADNKETAVGIADIVVKNFNKLPEDIISKLPEDIRNELLRRLKNYK